MKSKWNEKSTADKIMLVLRIVISVVVLVSASLKLLNVWDIYRSFDRCSIADNGCMG